MTQDEIIELARQAGIDIGIWEKLSDDDDVFGYGVDGTHENLEAFAKLVAEKEREACAKVCEGRIGGAVQDNQWWLGFRAAMRQCAEVIRARGQT